MSIFSFTAQDVNGDPLTDGLDINIVNQSTTELSFTDIDDQFGDPLPGETVSVDGGPPQTYEVLGTGDVRGDPLQKAIFIRLADGTTFAIDLNADGDDTADLQNGNTGLKVSDLDPDDEPDFPVPPDPVCFVPGTLILTPGGEVAIEALRTGDLVTTLDGGEQPIRWIGRRTVRFEPGAHRHKPILIGAGSLGPDVPGRDLVVSPQHRVMLCGPRVEAVCTDGEVLALAKGLAGLPGIRSMNGKREIDYITILLDRHAILIADGCPAESFFPGPTALRMIGRAMREQVLGLFPALRASPEDGYGAPVRKVLKMREVRELLAQANGCPLTARRLLPVCAAAAEGDAKGPDPSMHGPKSAPPRPAGLAVH